MDIKGTKVYDNLGNLHNKSGNPHSGGTVLALEAPGEVEAVSFEAAGLGDRSYLVHDGRVGVVVDPQREPQRYLAAAESLGVSITHVLETHIHNDYVSGGLGLARQLGATYVLPQGEQLAFAEECTTLGDGDELTTGSLKVSALATPGHTPHHLSYLLSGRTGARSYVCTGGSVLPNGVGRTDLLGDERADELAQAQWHSVRRLLSQLDAATRLLPTHGFGSFCTVTPAAGAEGTGAETRAEAGELASRAEGARAEAGGAEAGELAAGELTIGLERERNPAARAALEDFVLALRQDRPPVPSYYRYMAPLNRAGAASPHYQPTARLDAAALERWLSTGSVVADLRPRRAFAAGHRQGSLNIELGSNLTTYFGWVVPFEAPYTLIACSYEEVERSRHLLARIGRELVSGFVLASDLDLERARHYPVATFADLSAAVQRGERPLVLDVRHRSEWRAGHLALACHVPLPELEAQRGSLPPEQPIWVHCGAGFRAALAASRLSAWGMSPVLVDDLFGRAAPYGLEMTVGDGPSGRL
jgi:glyoxylase-like metal-dependent hydrolase (beta-lactamase superfamily II)/rhodanese-related sulfurtransferase